MAEWVRSLLDIVLIVMVGIGLYQAARLIKHLAGLRQGRVDMERFVHDFNSTVIRAEAGIKGLRHAARESGDDLERLVEKAYAIRDELNFLVESGDQVAERLSQSASAANHPEKKPEVAKSASDSKSGQAASNVRSLDTKEQAAPTSRAEKELLQALQKLS